MNWSELVYLFYITKTFTPFLSFMVPYIIENGEFTNKELYNILNPFFFISSLFVSLFSCIIIERLGNKASLLLDTFLELLVYIIFCILPKRNFFLAGFACALHGASTVMNSVLRSTLISMPPGDENSGMVMRNVHLLKNVFGIFSSWIGQDIYICCRNHNVNISISIFMLLLSLIIVLFFPGSSKRVENDYGILKYLHSYSEMKKMILQTYDYKTIVYSLLYITTNILTICLSFFAASIFIERRKNTKPIDVKVKNLLFCISMPFRMISMLFIKMYSIFGDIDVSVDLEKKIVIHGYIDGLSKLVSSCFSFVITSINLDSFESSHMKFFFFCLITFITILSIYMLGRFNSLMLSYIFFIVAYSTTTAVKPMIFVEIKRNPGKNFIFSFNLFLSSVIHIVLSYVSLYYESNVRQRFLYYFFVSCALVLSSIIIYICKCL